MFSHIGNAVPPLLAKAIGKAIYSVLSGVIISDYLEIRRDSGYGRRR